MTKLISFLIFKVIVLLDNIKNSESARILAITNSDSISRYIMFEPYLLELAKRNHKIIVFSPIKPLSEEATVNKNMKFINLKQYINFIDSNFDINDVISDSWNNNVLKKLISTINVFYDLSNSVNYLNCPELKGILKSNETFDLLITDHFDTDILIGFSYKLKIPNVLFSSLPLLPWANHRFGNPDNPSYIPVSLGDYSVCMEFWQRLINTIYSVSFKLAYYFLYSITTQKIANKYFGDDLPNLIEYGKNSSIIFVNTHYTIHGARPSPPNVIEVGGIHIQPSKKLKQVGTV